MIKSLSPYWLYIPLVSPITSLTCTDFTLEVFVWNGDKGNPPTTPSYEATIKNPTASTGNKRVDIANLISDFVDFTQQEGTGTELINGNNQNWVKWRTYYTTTDETDATTPSNQNVELMTRGYAYGMDGENTSTPANKILLSGNEFKVSRNSVFVLPIEIEQSETPTPSITINSITNVSGNTYEMAITKVGSYSGGSIYIYEVGSAFDLIINVDNLISPLVFEIETPIVSTDYNIEIKAFENVTSTLITSNTFALTLP